MKMTVIVISAILLTYVVGQYFYSRHFAEQARRLTQTVYTDTATLGQSGNHLHMLVAGDSLGAGIGASSFETSLAGRVASHLADGNKVTITNHSRSGARMADLMNTPAPARSDVTVLVISSNDLLHFTDLRQFRVTTEQVIERYTANTKQLVVIGPGNIGGTAGIIPPPLRPVYRYRHGKYAEILRDVSAKYSHVEYIDPVADEAPRGKVYGPTVSSVDKFHLNDEGYRYWADLVIAALK
jgi:lysophospholipase L1-like esterase